MLTPEREHEIREMGNGNEFLLFDAKEELLEEINRLRSQLKVTERALIHYTENLNVAIEALERYNTDDEYSANIAHEALSKIRGEK